MKEQKFNQIVAENSELIRRICRYYNDNTHDQEDMYQEVLINIWKSLDKFRGDSKLSTYIYRIAVNVSIAFASKSFKDSKLYISADTSNIGEILDSPDDDKAELEKQIEQLHNALNTLSVIDKALISLLLEGLTMREIAKYSYIKRGGPSIIIYNILFLSKKTTQRIQSIRLFTAHLSCFEKHCKKIQLLRIFRFVGFSSNHNFRCIVKSRLWV